VEGTSGAVNCGRFRERPWKAALQDEPFFSDFGTSGKLILPSRLVAARYATGGRRGRFTARPLFEHGFPGYGECRQATWGVWVDRVGVNPC
jgi:hypothetical protein